MTSPAGGGVLGSANKVLTSLCLFSLFKSQRTAANESQSWSFSKATTLPVHTNQLLYLNYTFFLHENACLRAPFTN